MLLAVYLALSMQPGLTDGLGSSRDMLFGKGFIYVKFLVFAALIFLVVRFSDAIIFDLALASRKIDVPVLLRQIIAFSLYLFFISVVFSILFERNILGFLTAGTVVAAVIGLALQDTLGNLFSGVALHVEHAFDIGDVVRSGDNVGVVESMNWRATRLRTFNNNIIVVPNSLISRERIEIHQKHGLNARVIRIGLPYHVPPARIIPILQQVASNVVDVSHDIPCLSRVGDFGDSAVIYEIKYWTRNFQRRDMIDAEIRRAVWYALRRNDIEIPFPIRTLQRWKETASESGSTNEEIRSRLWEVEILAPLSSDERDALAGQAKLHTYARGETILRRGEVGDSMFVIHEGEVSVRMPVDGVAREVARLGSGNVFGEMALLTGESRSADVVALTDVQTVEIVRESLQPIIRDNPDLAAAFSAQMMERQDLLAPDKAATADEQKTLMTRIRGYFGLVSRS
ncbi:MAG: mechanosensitive ion channel family protein [Acidobacteriota bacterium]